MLENVQDLGIVKISDEVVATATGIAATTVPGVNSLHGSIRAGLAELLGKRDATRGIDVQMDNGTVTITVSIVVDFGVRIPDVAWKVQLNVKKHVEEMTGLVVNEVHVNVQGVAAPLEEKESPAE